MDMFKHTGAADACFEVKYPKKRAYRIRIKFVLARR